MDFAAAMTARWRRAMCVPFRWFRTRGSRRLLSSLGRRGQFGRGLARSSGESNLPPRYTKRPYKCLTFRATIGACAPMGNRDADRCRARDGAAQCAAGVSGHWPSRSCRGHRACFRTIASRRPSWLIRPASGSKAASRGVTPASLERRARSGCPGAECALQCGRPMAVVQFRPGRRKSARSCAARGEASRRKRQ